MSSIVPCPECGRKLKVPETAAGKSFRCPGCKTIISSLSESLSEEGDEVGDESETPSPSRSIRATPASRTAPTSSGSRSRDAERENDTDPADEEPIRERRPRKKKPIRKKSSTGLIIGLVAGGVALLLLVLGVGGGVLWYVSRNKSIPQSEWKTFSPENSGCTVVMPGTPTLQTQQIGGISAKHYKVERRTEGATFELGFFELPAPALRPTILSDMVKGARDNVIAMSGGTATSETNISLRDIPGREFQIKTPTQVTFVTRVYLAKFGNMHRAYMVIVGGQNIQPDKGDAARYLDSFTIDASAAPPNLDAPAPQVGAQPPPDAKPPQANPQPNPARPNPARRPPRMPQRRQPQSMLSPGVDARFS